MNLDKYSFGVGDRFGMQGKAQLQAFLKARDHHVRISPVWNKSHREHSTIKTDPVSVREKADAAVKELNWQDPYFVDADHISMPIVDPYIPVSDFFTIDVAAFIGEKASENTIREFIEFNSSYTGTLEIPGMKEPFDITEDFILNVGEKFLQATSEASKIYQHILAKKGGDNFIAEISMDEVEDPQTPAELFFILSALKFNEVTVRTIAPKFSGRFNKGVDYVGDVDKFEREFEQDLLVIDYAVKEFGLPANIKLSVHSGSDKFSLYPVISRLIRKHGKGVHVKTAGTTWLEELAGLALSGGEGLEMAREIFKTALDRYDELTAPYSTVIDIKPEKLPGKQEIENWDKLKFSRSLRHDPSDPDYNPAFRQLLHVGYKIAAEYGDDFRSLVTKNESLISSLVTENLFDKHIRPLFIQ